MLRRSRKHRRSRGLVCRTLKVDAQLFGELALLTLERLVERRLLPAAAADDLAIGMTVL